MCRPIVVCIALVNMLIFTLLSTDSIAQASPPTVAPDFVLILSAPGSMWGQVEGENKIVIARGIRKNLVAGLSTEGEAGLVAYLRRQKGDCEDIETLLPLGALDKDAMTRRLTRLFRGEDAHHQSGARGLSHLKVPAKGAHRCPGE